VNEAEFTKMTVQETKWSEAAGSEAIESATKAMGYDTLKPEQKSLFQSL